MLIGEVNTVNQSINQWINKNTRYIMITLSSRFRRQHEQLRQVIVRVLQPPAKEQANARVPNEEMVDLQAATASLDPADANAIEEVNLAYENTKDVDALDISKEGNEAWEAAMKR
jgi:dynein heavy chain 1